MKVFISWSKMKSMKFALKTKEVLESINPTIEAFVSEVDISGGEDVQSEIIKRIEKCDTLVICFTKENKKSPWLLFEAGYARGLKKIVVPILFDEDPNWHSWVDNPMNIAREINFNNNFNNNFSKQFSIVDTLSNKQKLKKYEKSILKIKKQFKNVDTECEDFVEALVHSGAFIKENPIFDNKTAFFLTGFESYDLLRIITDSFMHTGKYLWIYGRKNMKLFGGSFDELFNYLKGKAMDQERMMDGIDFRCLFLNPDSDEIERAHQQQDILKLELDATILRAMNIIGDNITFRKCFKQYSNRREEIIIRLDNCIIYSRPIFDAQGRPHLLTNSNFEVFSANSSRGKECINKYEKVWNNAKEL